MYNTLNIVLERTFYRFLYVRSWGTFASFVSTVVKQALLNDNCAAYTTKLRGTVQDIFSDSRFVRVLNSETSEKRESFHKKIRVLRPQMFWFIISTVTFVSLCLVGLNSFYWFFNDLKNEIPVHGFRIYQYLEPKSVDARNKFQSLF